MSFAPLQRSTSLLGIFGFLFLSSFGCQRTSTSAPSGNDAGNDAALVTSATSASTTPSGAPLSRIVPKPRTGPRTVCPMEIVPSESFGPIALGETLDDLKRGGLVVSNVSETHAEVSVPSTSKSGKSDESSTIKVSLCNGKIIAIWIDDLRLSSCVTYQGKAIAPSIPREELETLVGGCKDTSPRIGGTFEQCNGGGLYVGHGMGNFLQLRVHPKELPFDDACSIATDDGSPIDLSAKEKSYFLRQTLNLSELSKYWHVDKPGRDPLRIVKTPLLAPESLKMFGSDVVWITEAEAKKGTAYLVITKLVATKTKATVGFSYPIEGVTGTALFAHSGGPDGWRLESASVAEH